MEINSKEYFFIEWMILAKGITTEQYLNLTQEDLDILRKEYSVFLSKLNHVNWHLRKEG